MWQDINGKTGHNNMQGNVFLYANMKLLDTAELVECLKDGITYFVQPPKTPLTAQQQLQTMKRQLNSMVEEAFSEKTETPIVINGMTFAAGIESANTLNSLKSLAMLNGLSIVPLYDINGAEHTPTIPETDTIIRAVANSFKVDFDLKLKAQKDIMSVGSEADISNLTLPWGLDPAIVLSIL